MYHLRNEIGRKENESKFLAPIFPLKLIILDIDGVMNCSYCKDFIDDIYFVMDCKIELLKELIDRTGARVLLSSSWRYGWIDLLEGRETRNKRHFLALQEKFREYGIEFFDYTPDLGDERMERRGEEIEAWFQAWDWEKEPIEGYVIIDDVNGKYLRPHSNRAIRTSKAYGLQPKHIDLAEKILNKPYIRKENA